jgi:ABC-type glutathione transport system ATPase component
VLVTQFIEEAERLCDRIAVIDSGRIVALDTPAALASGADADQRIRFVAATPGLPDPRTARELDPSGHLRAGDRPRKIPPFWHLRVTPRRAVRSYRRSQNQPPRRPGLPGSGMWRMTEEMAVKRIRIDRLRTRRERPWLEVLPLDRETRMSSGSRRSPGPPIPAGR